MLSESRVDPRTVRSDIVFPAWISSLLYFQLLGFVSPWLVRLIKPWLALEKLCRCRSFRGRKQTHPSLSTQPCPLCYSGAGFTGCCSCSLTHWHNYSPIPETSICSLPAWDSDITEVWSLSLETLVWYQLSIRISPNTEWVGITPSTYFFQVWEVWCFPET